MPHPSMFGTAASVGAYRQNLVDASPAWLYSTNGMEGGSGDRFTMSLWFKYFDNLSDQYIFTGHDIFISDEYSINIWIGTSDQLNIEIVSAGVTRASLTSSINTFDDGVFYNLLISGIDDTQDSIKAYLNDVDVSLSGTQPVANWDLHIADNVTLLADKDQANPLDPRELGDYWWGREYFDLDVEANRRKFITGNKEPVFLGLNGELPFGTPPRTFFGSDYVAANWNTGFNLGAGTAFIEGSVGWDNFLDVA